MEKKKKEDRSKVNFKPGEEKSSKKAPEEKLSKETTGKTTV